MIKSYRNKTLRRFAEKGDARKLPLQNADRVRRILAILDAAKTIKDIDQPGMVLHLLHQSDRYSMRVTGNWRITFRWTGAHAEDVDLEDYH